MNIIITCGGKGERFSNNGYHLPKPLIKSNGKEIIYHLLDNLKFHKDDDVYIFANINLHKYKFDTQLNIKYPHISVIYIQDTPSVITTLQYGFKKISPKYKKTVILDCDNFYNIDVLAMYRNADNNALMYICNEDPEPRFSYIELEGDRIVNIVEKQKISNFANCGCYCFRDYKLITDFKIQDCKYELHLSFIVKTLIDNGEIFNANYIESQNFVCLGTPLQLLQYSNDCKYRFCFDLDGTLVSDYNNIPITKNIEYLRFLKSQGHYIIIYTARRMRTYNGNIGKVISDIAKSTILDLEKLCIPYDELVFGKPYAHFYIDDLGINANRELEKEIGIYNKINNCRDFNTIKFDNNRVIKSSIDPKINGEIYWYQNHPIEFNFIPKFFGCTLLSYEIEKIEGLTFSQLYVNELLNEKVFINFLNTIKYMHSYRGDQIVNYAKKIKDRYISYDYSKFVDSDRIYNNLIDQITNHNPIIGIIHGDPVFSNIIFDTSNNIKMIDMRGIVDDKLTIYGDIYYDLAKIYQSLIGYEEIIHDQYVSDNYKNNLIHIFNNFVEKNYDHRDIKLITKTLFFTLIPLHDNNKCIKYFELSK